MTAAAPNAPASTRDGVGERKAGLLLLGNPTTSALRAVEIAAEETGMAVTLQTRTRVASDWLEVNHPAVIVVDVASRDLAAACLHLRENPRLGNVPVIVMVDAPSDLGFEELFNAGGDDLAVRGDDATLRRRLSILATAGEVPPARARGAAVVADSDRRRRVLTARVLRNAGYSVTFAVDVDETLAEAGREGVELVVSAADLETEATSLAARARQAGVKAAWVVATPPNETARIRSLVSGVRAATTYDSFGPCENLLFLANELERGAANDARASARLLYGTSVRYRVAGTETDEIGYTYNVSAGGLYVRTLAPLVRGSEAWIELRPPRSERRVRLEGRVVWVRTFGPNDYATVPPGFGLEITGSSLVEVERYVRSYRAYAAELAGL